MVDWSTKWLLRFHPQKCKVMTLGNCVGRIDHTYSMKENSGRVDLERVPHEKDIGVVVDDRLNFELHIQEKVNKANRIMGLIRRTFEFLVEENFRLLYKALVRPHIEYANAIWAPYKKKDILVVENIQRRATKLIPSLRNLSYEERLKKLNIPTLVYRRARGDMIEYYKIAHNVYDPECTKFLPGGLTDQLTRGHKHKFYMRHSNLNMRKNCFGIRNVLYLEQSPRVCCGSPKCENL